MVQMSKRQQQEGSNEWRDRLIKVLALDVHVYSLPFFRIELALQLLCLLQMLKFAVDSFPLYWVGSAQPVFLYLDLSYYFTFLSPTAFFRLALLFMVLINLYWMLPLLLYLYALQRSHPISQLCKALYLLFRYLLLLPAFNVLLNMLNCRGSPGYYRKCYEHYELPLVAAYALSFMLFLACVMGQTYLHFQFLRREKTEVRLRRSGISSCLFVLYALVNELSSYLLIDGPRLAILNITTIAFLFLLIFTNDEVSEKIKLMQVAFLAVQLLAALFVDIAQVGSPGLPPFLLAVVGPTLFAGVMRVKTTNLRFQLQNINKWPTPQIMISYAGKLRDYLALRSDYTYAVYIHGYMEIHRQKCDNPNCPSRCQLNQQDRKLFQSGVLQTHEEQLLRCENIVKKIYSDGYILTPVSPQLQLENAIFQYQRGDKQLALRSLLGMKLERLSLDKYYRFQLLRDKIHHELNLDSNKFLDLVSEMEAKREQALIFQGFERAALVNLEFWSLLNDDHPDFQKLNEVAKTRIQVREQIRSSYAQICGIAHSEKVTGSYANYLEAVENDQQMFSEIYADIKKKYGLDQKITLQDWANSSSNIMLVSVDDAALGKIVDINTSCATLLGYQKYELQSQSLKGLFMDELRYELKEFLGEESNGRHFHLTHKSGYLLRVGKQAQRYNSIETGLTAILTLEPILTPYAASFLLDHKSKLIGITSSAIPLLGVDLRVFESEAYTWQVFMTDLKSLRNMATDKEQTYALKELVKKEFYLSEERGQSRFKVAFSEYSKHLVLDLRQVVRGRRGGEVRSLVSEDFQFRVQASVGCLKYLGTNSQASPTTSNFSRLYSSHHSPQVEQNIYEKGITTLRLRDNVIQIIEDEEASQLNDRNGNSAQDSSQQLIIPRKDEEEIFGKKDRFEKFIRDYKIAEYLLGVMMIGFLGAVGLQVGYYAVYISHSASLGQQSLLLSQQHLINGAVTKQQALLVGLQLAATNFSSEPSSHFHTIYRDNLQFLEEIQMSGLSPFPLSLQVDSQTTKILTHEFLLSMINSASQFASALSPTASATIMWTAFSQLDHYVQSYLTEGCRQAKQQMYAFSLAAEHQLSSLMRGWQDSEAVMVSMALLYLLIYLLAIFAVIHRINGERINIFEIFLQVPDSKIQQFSNRTEKLLVSLHVEEANEDLDEETDKKVSSSTFSKKKSFKQVSFAKNIYLKMLVVPLFFAGYFAHSYTLAASNLSFQTNALPYFRLSAAADYLLYTNLTLIQQTIANYDPASAPDAMEIGVAIRLYYRQYLEVHYNSFAFIANYHDAWTSLFFQNICPGSSTPFGNTTIPQSCLLGSLADNGTFMVAGDLIHKVETLNFSLPLKAFIPHEYETLSKTHRLVTSFLAQAQQALSDGFSRMMVELMVIWVVSGVGLVLLWGVPMTRSFLGEINEIKNIISILPISLAKQLPNARKYFRKILKQQTC